jgi:uncharacterized membrane protein
MSLLAEPLPFRMLLDEAMKKVREQFHRIYLPIALPVALASATLPLGQRSYLRAMSQMEHHTFDPAALFSGLAVFLALLLFFVIVQALAAGAMITAAMDVVSGRELSVRRAWLFMLRPRAFGTLLLVWLVVFLGFLFCILPGIYLSLLMALSVPVMADEGRFGPSALRRSAELCSYNPQREFMADPRVKIFIIFFVGFLLGYILSAVVSLPLIALQQVILFRGIAAGHRVDPSAMMAQMTWFQIPTQILGSLVHSGVGLYVNFGISLLFVDLRNRKEGGDLQAAISHLSGQPGVLS